MSGLIIFLCIIKNQEQIDQMRRWRKSYYSSISTHSPLKELFSSQHLISCNSVHRLVGNMSPYRRKGSFSSNLCTKFQGFPNIFWPKAVWPQSKVICFPTIKQVTINPNHLVLPFQKFRANFLISYYEV